MKSLPRLLALAAMVGALLLLRGDGPAPQAAEPLTTMPRVRRIVVPRQCMDIVLLCHRITAADERDIHDLTNQVEDLQLRLDTCNAEVARLNPSL